MVAPFSLKAGIGNYRGRKKDMSDAEANLTDRTHEGFNNYYNSSNPIIKKKADAIKTRIKTLLRYNKIHP